VIVTASVQSFRKVYRRMQGFAEHEADSSDTRAPVPPSTVGTGRRTPSPAPAVPMGSGPTEATRPPSLNTKVRPLLPWPTLAACVRRAVGLP